MSKPPNLWRDRTYLAYVATETVLFLDDAVFKVGLRHSGSPTPATHRTAWHFC
ncbi:hypothetical protein [Streptomyces sp. NBC_01515]|uniref:hypothetical protein n=1 Tax=Streptomyces sp. NBC_01515 TaxID=2903890 RepID=UPI00386CEDDC